MARPWLSIRVALIEGGGRTLCPRPGCVFVAAMASALVAAGAGRWTLLVLDELAAGLDPVLRRRCGVVPLSYSGRHDPAGLIRVMDDSGQRRSSAFRAQQGRAAV